MKSAAECLVLAGQMEARARECPDDMSREAYLAMAGDWRRTAAFAQQQEYQAKRELSTGSSAGK